MIKFLKSILARYLITVAVGLSFVYSYIAPRDLANQTLIEQYHILCDAFTLPGLFMMLIGLMLLMGNLGALDAISFAFHYLFHTFLPLTGESMTYLEFVEDRREHRIHGYGFLFIVGAVFTAIAVVFLLLYMS